MLQKKIVFLYHYDTNWYNLHPVYQLCSKNTNLDVKVVVLQRILGESSSQDIVYPDCDFLVKNNISFIYSENFDFEKEKTDYVMYGLPYDNFLPEKFKICNVYKIVKNIGYIKYSLALVNEKSIINIVFQLDTFTHMTNIFCNTTEEKNLFLTNKKMKEENIFVTAIPKFDRLFYLDEYKPDSILQEKINGRYTIVWNSHYSLVKDRWSTLANMFKVFVEHFMNRKDVAFIWRPHPRTDSDLNAFRLMLKYEIGLMVEELEELGIIVDLSANHIDSFALADIFLSDVSSLMYEFVSTGKPMIVLKKPDYDLQFLPNMKSFSNGFYIADNPNDVLSIINNIKNGIDPKKVFRNVNKKRTVDIYDGKASERIYSCIINQLEVQV